MVSGLRRGRHAIATLLFAAAVAVCSGARPTTTPANGGWPVIPPSSLIPLKITASHTVALPTSPLPQAGAPQLGTSTTGQAPQFFANESVSFLGPHDGWVTAPGSISVTTDGGTRWSTFKLRNTMLLRLTFASPRQGWAVGTTIPCGQYTNTPSNGPVGTGDKISPCPMRILHTTDGGLTWTTQFTSGCASVSCPEPAIHFTNQIDGWALLDCLTGTNSQCAEILHTTNGGRAWIPVPLPQGFEAVDVTAVGRDAWISGTHCTPAVAQGHLCPTELLRTTDDGQTWTATNPAQTATGRHHPASLGGGHLSFVNRRDGWLFSTTLLVTTDGGKTWATLQTKQPGDGIWPRTVHVLNRFTAVAATLPLGSRAVGGIAITRDGGHIWTNHDGNPSAQVDSIAAPSPSDLWATGTATDALGQTTPFLTHSIDGGIQWTVVTPPPRPAQAIDFLSPSTGFGLGTASDPVAVLVTHDSGRTWAVVNSHTAATGIILTNISFANQNDGWIAGNAPGQTVVLRATTDGGRTWSTIRRLHAPQQTHASIATATIHVAGTGQGIIVTTSWTPGAGESDSAQWTTNNGATWTSLPDVAIGGYTHLISQAYYGTHRSWALTSIAGRQDVDDIKLLASTGNGTKWDVLFSTKANVFVAAADPINRSSGWVAMNEGKTILFHTTNRAKTWTQIALPGFQSAQIDFISNRTGWLLTGNHLWRTNNGGLGWRQMY